MTITEIMKQYFVYIVTNFNNKVLYIGVTNDLTRRIFEHKNKLIKGFTEKYNLTKLVYFEQFSRIEDALLAEKRLKNWHREWKINLIKKSNPEFKDLSQHTMSS
jgi:putative endonuclease